MSIYNIFSWVINSNKFRKSDFFYFFMFVYKFSEKLKKNYFFPMKCLKFCFSKFNCKKSSR